MVYYTSISSCKISLSSCENSFGEIEQMKKFLGRNFILEYKMWIALGTVLERFFTFWLFLMHWLAFPYRCIVKLYSIILLLIFKKK